MKKVDFSTRYSIMNGLKELNIKGVRFLTHKLKDFLLPIPDEAVVITTTRKLLFKVNPKEDKGVELQLYQFGTYEEGTLCFIEKYLNPGDVFVDVGANIGLMSIVAAKRVGATGKVIAYEAHPETYAELVENCERNNCTNVTAVHKAIGEQAGKVFIALDPINKGASSIVASNGAGAEVDCITLDAEILTRLNMIKIDVEGFELPVFRGAKESLAQHQPIVIFESIKELTDSSSTQEVYTLLSDLGYRFYLLKKSKDKNSGLIEMLSLNDFPQHDNVFCFPKGKTV